MTTLQGNSWTWYPFNQIQRRTGSGLNLTYGYTVDGERLLSWNRAISPDSFNISVRNLDGKVIREFRYDGGTQTYSWVKDYIHANGKLLATVDAENGTRYYHLDHLGTPRVITDENGNLITDDEGNPIGLNTYSPFGIQLTGERGERLKFTGHERDAGNIDYMHARYYSPIVARFLSVDPAGAATDNPQSWNRYSYTYNNPLGATDPDGRVTLVISDVKLKFLKQWRADVYWGMLEIPVVGTAMAAAFDTGVGAFPSDEDLLAELVPCPATASAPGKLANRVINSNLRHAAERAAGDIANGVAGRSNFKTINKAADALRQLGKTINENGIPANSIKHPFMDDRIAAPLKEGGAAVYQITKKGKLRLKTVISDDQLAAWVETAARQGGT